MIVRAPSTWNEYVPGQGMPGVNGLGDLSPTDESLWDIAESNDGWNSSAGWNQTPVPYNPNAPGMTPIQTAGLISQIASSSAAIVRSLQTPNTVPGSNLVYNPSTGALVPASGAGLSLTSTGVSASLGGSLPLLLIAGAAFLLLGKK